MPPHPLSIPITPPSGSVYSWKAMSFRGETNHGYLEMLIEKGWGRVPAGEQPELPSKDGFIEYDGMWLMTRSVVLEQAAQVAQQLLNDKVIANTPAKRLGHPHDFKLHDEVWDRRSGKFIGYVVEALKFSFEVQLSRRAPDPLPQIGAWDEAKQDHVWRQSTLAEWLRSDCGHTISSNEGERPGRGGFPLMDDMVHTEAEAVAYMNRRSKSVSEALNANGFDTPDFTKDQS